MTSELLRPRGPITQTVLESLPSVETESFYKMLSKFWGQPL